MIAPGLAHPWHFDTNEFTVSLLTQQARDGGVFEYCPNIRSADAENLDDVAAVLAGRGEHLVRHSSCAPATCDCSAVGSLCTMAPLCGDQARHTAIFAYSECAGVIDSAERTRQLFGRILPEHAEGEGRAVCVDHLLD